MMTEWIKGKPTHAGFYWIMREDCNYVEFVEAYNDEALIVSYVTSPYQLTRDIEWHMPIIKPEPFLKKDILMNKERKIWQSILEICQTYPLPKYDLSQILQEWYDTRKELEKEIENG
jgi:hypothetical protein